MIFKVVARTGFPYTLAEKILNDAGIRMVRVPLLMENQIIEYAADADAALVSAIEPYTSTAIRSLKKCKIISRLGIGFNNIDVDEATRQGIPVAVVLDASVEEVSDHALAFILAFSRKIFPLNQAIRKGVWKAATGEINQVRGQMFRLNTRILGIVGVGRIGSRVARKARAFGLRVLGYDPYVSAEELWKSGADKVEFDQLLQEADFVSLHAPLTPETNKMFGLKEFQKMKATAFLINTARGGIIDEQALYKAIKEGKITGAGLDVNDPEPPSFDNPLLTLDQVLMTGHSAFFSESSMQDLEQRAVEAIILALQGEWPAFLANPEVKEKENRRIP